MEIENTLNNLFKDYSIEISADFYRHGIVYVDPDDYELITIHKSSVDNRINISYRVWAECLKNHDIPYSKLLPIIKQYAKL